MKITVTEEMRELVQQAREAGDIAKSATNFTEKAKSEHRSILVRLGEKVAEAAMKEEARMFACAEPECDTEKRRDSVFCEAHDQEHTAERERYMAERKAGKPCEVCAFVGSECATCQGYREMEEKRDSDA